LIKIFYFLLKKNIIWSWFKKIAENYFSINHVAFLDKKLGRCVTLHYEYSKNKKYNDVLLLPTRLPKWKQ
jgi:hypothetical protein